MIERVLIISYDFSPEEKPNAYRWHNIAKHWKERGVEVFVLSAEKGTFPRYQEIDGIKIYRTTEYFIGNLKYKLRGDNNIQRSQKHGSRFNFKTLLRKVYDSTWSKTYWPDYSFLWYFSGIRKASNLITENKIDTIITVSWTYTAHLIGHRLKARFKCLFWLADTIDPFSIDSHINNKRLYNRLNSRSERKIFKASNHNVVLTENIKQYYLQNFGLSNNQISVIGNLFTPTDFNYEKTYKFDEVYKLVFLGTLNQDVRPPDNLLRLISIFSNRYPNFHFRVDFYGNHFECLSTFESFTDIYEKKVFLNGLKTKSEVEMIIKEADVLVNIGNTNIYQEPSKLIEYMFSRKKILNVCTLDQDTSARLLEKYPLNLNVFPGELELGSVADKIHAFFKSAISIKQPEVEQLLESNLLENISNQYLSALESKL